MGLHGMKRNSSRNFSTVFTDRPCQEHCNMMMLLNSVVYICGTLSHTSNTPDGCQYSTQCSNKNFDEGCIAGGRISYSKKFNVKPDCISRGPIRTLLNSMLGKPNIGGY